MPDVFIPYARATEEAAIADHREAVTVLFADIAGFTPLASRMAQDMVAAVARIAAEQGEPLNVRTGLHSGPVVAGVIGRRKFSDDLWGDTVNVASRLESASQPGRVNVSSETRRLIGERIACEFRGSLAAKGKGRIEMYFIASGPDASGGPGDGMVVGTASPAAG